MKAVGIMNNYRFKKPHKDHDIQEIQRQIEDNFAIKSEVDEKRNKVVNIEKSVPTLNSMKDGDEVAYFDGSTYYKYYRIGGKLFKKEITEA